MQPQLLGAPTNRSFRSWVKENLGRKELRHIAERNAKHATFARIPGLSHRHDREILYETYAPELWDRLAMTARWESDLPMLGFVDSCAGTLHGRLPESYQELTDLVVRLNALFVARDILGYEAFLPGAYRKALR